MAGWRNHLASGSTSRGLRISLEPATTTSRAIGSRLSRTIVGVRRARAITVAAGLISKPIALTHRAAATAVVVPEPFQGSSRYAHSLKWRVSADSTKLAEKPA